MARFSKLCERCGRSKQKVGHLAVIGMQQSWGVNYPLVIEHSRGNGSFIDDFPIKTSIYKGFSMAMLNNQRVSRPRPMARAKWLESSPWPFLNPPEPPEARHRKTPGNRKAMVWSNQRMIGRLPSWYPHSPHDFAQYVVSMFDQSKDGATIEEVAIQRGAADHLNFP